jgi:phage head maturation protease
MPPTNVKRQPDTLAKRFELEEAFLSSPNTAALKSAVIRAVDRRNGEPVILKYWEKTGTAVDADFRELWRHEMRQSERVRAFPRADEVVVEVDMVIASPSTGLELEDSALGLLFRLPMHRAKNAAIVARMVDVGNRACASVCYEVADERTEEIGGHQVRVIGRANLREISLVKRGAIEQAFAFLSDSVNNPTVRGLERSTIFALDKLTHTLKRATRDHLEESAQLAARVNRLSAKYGLPPI